MEQDLTPKIRAVFLTSGGILGDTVLRRLLASGRFDVVGIVRSRRIKLRGAGFFRGAASYFADCGVLYTIYIWAVTTLAEAIGFVTGNGSASARAERWRIPVLHTKDVNDARGREFITSLAPELLVSAHFDQRLYPPLCHRAGMVAVNIHPSLLPADRGLEPVLQIMARGSDSFGVTLHRLEPAIDTGAVITEKCHFPSQHHSVLRVTRDLLAIGANLLIECAPNLRHPSLGRPQHGPACYHSWPDARVVRKLHSKGRRLAAITDAVFFWR